MLLLQIGGTTMSLFLAPDDGPFVFGAFAAHLNQAEPVGPALALAPVGESDDVTPAPEPGLKGVPNLPASAAEPSAAASGVTAVARR